jgi:hypothetical protein
MSRKSGNRTVEAALGTWARRAAWTAVLVTATASGSGAAVMLGHPVSDLSFGVASAAMAGADLRSGASGAIGASPDCVGAVELAGRGLGRGERREDTRGSSAQIHGGSSADRYGGSSADRGGVAGERDRRVYGQPRPARPARAEEPRTPTDEELQEIRDAKEGNGGGSRGVGGWDPNSGNRDRDGGGSRTLR